MTPVEPRVIIVGSGHGLRVHLPALRQSGFNVVGLVGRDAERTQNRAAKNGIAAAFTDLAEAIEQTGAQAVTVASTPADHGSQVQIAIEHGCHVLCEKPFARDAAEAKRLLNAANAAGVVHMLGHQLRAMPERRVAQRAISEGLIGRPEYVTFVQHLAMMSNTQARWPQWWFDADQGGGWLGASGSHMVDQLRDWLGDFAWVSASARVIADRESPTEDTYSVHFATRSGVHGVFTQTASSWGPMAQMTRVCGSRGALWLDNGEAWIADSDGVRTLPVEPAFQLLEMSPSDDPRHRFLHVELPPTLKLMQHWREAIVSGQAIKPFASFDDGLAVMQILDAIRESAVKDGERVAIAVR